ncbi:MAG: hypothetical protein A3F17_01160 [Gammaproteobacteria bacterium RIFCSPHIGHO2_12_FULL_41_15]|nr:MAG: hypothetical protein A3F17_01160 [Gammaproteobacteria bacterium RIFCSPHIGHO2_12_FULL_41_15]
MTSLFKLFLLTLVSLQSVDALQFALPEGNNTVVGDLAFTKIQAGQDLSDIARRYDLGFSEVASANPKLNPEHLLLDSVVIIPTQFILPNVKHEGIVVNLPEMRLYYFQKHDKLVYTYPIGIGRKDWRTPIGRYKIIQKMKDPYWQVPDSIMAYRIKHGDPVQKIMPPGPTNPLGQFALRLSDPTYLIHGTIEPKGVGREVSAGCIRLYPEDIKELFSLVPNGTPVRIVDEPVKYGFDAGHLVIEAHPPLPEDAEDFWANLADLEKKLVKANDNAEPLHWNEVIKLAQEAMGIPTALTS